MTALMQLLFLLFESISTGSHSYQRSPLIMNSQITLPTLALSKTNKSVTLNIALQLNLVDPIINDQSIPIIEPVKSDPLQQASELQLTLALPVIQLNDSTSMKQDEKTVTKPDGQVKEALTEMVAPEEPKVVEPEPIGPPELLPMVSSAVDIPADSLLSSSSSLVSVQPNDSSSTEQQREEKINEVQPILVQEESPLVPTVEPESSPSVAPIIDQNILDEPEETLSDVHHSLEINPIIEPIASKSEDALPLHKLHLCNLVSPIDHLNDSSYLKSDEENTASSPVVQLIELLQTRVEEIPVENALVDEPKVASPTSSPLSTSQPATLYQPDAPTSSESLAPLTASSSASRSSTFASSTRSSRNKCRCRRSVEESSNLSLSSDDNSNVLFYTIEIDLNDKTVRIGPKPGRENKKLPVCSPKKPKDRSRSRDEEKKERRSSRHNNC